MSSSVFVSKFAIVSQSEREPRWYGRINHIATRGIRHVKQLNDSLLHRLIAFLSNLHYLPASRDFPSFLTFYFHILYCKPPGKKQRHICEPLAE